MTPRAYMDAARCPDEMKNAKVWPWRLERVPVETVPDLLRVGYDDLTILSREDSYAALHFERGEVVMEDSQQELRKHLPIWMEARGRVLVTGLGLGCVVRGLLAKPEVRHIDVIEIDEKIIALIGPEFAADPRVTIHHHDALTFPIDGRRWDYAWHDIWCEGNDGLQVLHGELIAHFVDVCPRQGAWAFPREISRILPHRLLGAPKTRLNQRSRPRQRRRMAA